MLISFSVGNFRSFGEEQTLNMIASNKLSDHPNHLVALAGTNKNVLRSAVIYGANAAGKSNLVKAMKFAKSAIVRGHMGRAQDRQDFAFSDTANPRSFEFRFIVGNDIFSYGFDRHNLAIQSEWLTIIDNETEHTVFERDKTGRATFGSLSSTRISADPDVKKVVEALSLIPLEHTQLFLNRVNNIPATARGETLNKIIEWFTEKLTILGPKHIEQRLVRLMHSAELQDFSSTLMNQLGTGIQRIRIHARKLNDNELPNRHSTLSSTIKNRFDYSYTTSHCDSYGIRSQQVLHLSSYHDDNDEVEFPFHEESDGTKQLLHLMPLLYSAGQDGKVIIIDELDRSLHPLICWEFIRLFSETNPGAPKQLIVTTHEAHLLNQDLLRRDEYWFVEKDKTQQSRLTSLIDFKVRNDLQIEKGYLHGRFGAIPMIGSMADLESMLNTPSNPEDAHAPQDPAPGA